MKMGNPYSRQLFLYLILYGLSSLQLAYAALGDGALPTLEITLVSVTYNVDRYTDTPAQVAYDYHFNEAKLLDKSMGPPRSGTSGYLFEIKIDCSNTTNITLHPDDNSATLPRVALITSSSCYMNGLTKAKNLNVKGAIVVANPSDPNQSPTLPEDNTFGFPIFVISAQDGSSQINYLDQYDQPLLGNNTANRLKAIMSYSSNFFPGVWEFTLIVVVVLLAVSFATSVAMHCHLYRIRRRQQRQRLNRRGTAGQLGMKNLTLNTEMLAKFPIRTYKASSIPARLDASSEQIDRTKDSSSEKQEVYPEGNKYVPADLEANVSMVDLSSNPISADDKSPSLGRNTSLNSNHSKKSVHSRKEGMPSRQVSMRSVRSTKSTRSANAITSATALAAGASDNNTVEDHSYNNTCAVCLEDFDEGDQLRTLTCGHEYHTECIDPWLTQKSSLCPLCKYDCVPKTEHENPEAPSDERNVYVGALLTWWPVLRGRNALQRIRGRSDNNAQDTQLESNTNESSTQLANTLASMEVQQPNASTSTLSRTQTNNSSHSVLQSSVSPGSNTRNETILREIAIAGHIG